MEFLRFSIDLFKKSDPSPPKGVGGEGRGKRKRCGKESGVMMKSIPIVARIMKQPCLRNDESLFHARSFP
jgi:hypothetical protein